MSENPGTGIAQFDVHSPTWFASRSLKTNTVGEDRTVAAMPTPLEMIIAGIIALVWTTRALRPAARWWQIGLLAVSLYLAVDVTYLALRGLVEGWGWLPSPVSPWFVLLWYMGAFPFVAGAIALLVVGLTRASHKRLLVGASLGPLLHSAWLILRPNIPTMPGTVASAWAIGLALCGLAVSVILGWNNISRGRVLGVS